MALSALRGDKTLTEIAQQYEVHPNQVTEWKRQLLERAADVFDVGTSTVKTDNEPDIKTLHAKIGQVGTAYFTKAARSSKRRAWHMRGASSMTCMPLLHPQRQKRWTGLANST